MKKTKNANCRYGRLHLHIIHILVWLGAVTCVMILFYHRIQRFEVLMDTESLRAEPAAVTSTNAASDMIADFGALRTVRNAIDIGAERNLPLDDIAEQNPHQKTLADVP